MSTMSTTCTTESAVKIADDTFSYSSKSFKYSLDGIHSQTSKFVTVDSIETELMYDNRKWLLHALPTNKSSSFGFTDYEQQSSSISEEDFTHTGFIQYLSIAWADEKGIVLRPDMFHHLISCEIAKNVIDNPEIYRSLYTKSTEKKNIEIVTPGDDNEFIRLLDLQLNSEIPHKEFKRQMTDIEFVSQPTNYEIVKRICFANSATPFYNYMRSRCGFPSIDIPDILSDWTILYDFVTKMTDIISAECKYVPRNSYDDETDLPIVKYLRKCSVHIKEIIDNFDNQSFLKDKLQSIFYVQDDYVCGSGHDFPYKIYGWITDFYLKKHPTLQMYPTHLPYLPYQFDGVGDFTIVSGLISSKLKENVLEAEYGNIVLKIKNRRLFDLIKN